MHSVDGTQHKVEFTVEGTNDKPVVLSAQSQSVTERWNPFIWPDACHGCGYKRHAYIHY
ncbi:VCBS domain-containing protein [Vibrio chagasii]|nr:VCBS domain-containing protein [Vibrio chagasii]